MGSLDGLFNQVKQAITQHTADNNGKVDHSSLFDQLSDLFLNHPSNQPNNRPGNVKPASQDPYGDPADQQGGAGRNIKPASQDPYGDPADGR